MILHNRRSDTYPIVLHAPGTCRRRASWRTWRQLALSQDPVDKGSTPGSVAVVTWETRPDPCLVEQVADRIGFSVDVLGRGKADWVNLDKVRLVIDWLSTCTADYVVGLDGRDVLLFDHPAEIVRRFVSSFSCDMLFNGARICWPLKVPQLAACDTWADSSKRGSRFLNAGVWVAKRGYALQFFRDVLDVNASAGFSGRMAVMEQPSVKLTAFRHYPHVDVDRQNMIFQHMAAGRRDLEIIRDPGALECAKVIDGDTQIWEDDAYRVKIQHHDRDPWGRLVRLAISRKDGTKAHHWADLQRLKNAIMGDECEAVEVYPPESRLQDTGHTYHLWCLPNPGQSYGIGWNERRKVSA